jgi:hypothetical protein
MPLNDILSVSMDNTPTILVIDVGKDDFDGSILADTVISGQLRDYSQSFFRKAKGTRFRVHGSPIKRLRFLLSAWSCTRLCPRLFLVSLMELHHQVREWLLRSTSVIEYSVAQSIT